MDNFFIDDEDYYSINVFQPSEVNPLIIIAPLPPAEPTLYLLEVPYSPKYNPNPLSGIL